MVNTMLYEYHMNPYSIHIENEIEKQKKQALTKFASIVSDSKFVDIIARLVASGSLEENPDAIKIINCLNIDKLEIFSLLEKDELFKKQYEKEMDWAFASDVYFDKILGD